MALAGQQAAINSPEVETWDDDDFENIDDIHFRTASTATSVISHPQAGHRDSSSRMSLRSDSNHGDEQWNVLVDEQSSVKDAVSIAKSKGIPLPTNVPRSALEGGTIRRLGGKAIKRAIADDWSEDLDFANAPSQLRLAKQEDRDLSENLRQISAAFHSSPQSPEVKDLAETIKSPKSRPAPTPVSLDHFRDVDDADDFEDVPTIRVAKHRSPQRSSFIHGMTAAVKPEMEDIEEDFELPSDGKLRLSVKKPSPRTPLQGDEFDLEWAEGSLGTRRAGMKRGGRSNRSSSASALSPSVSSAFTAESEDEGLDGLELPKGPLNFGHILKKRQEQEKEQEKERETQGPMLVRPEDDWSKDLVIPQGRVLDEAKLTLHRNIKQKPQRSTSPGKIKATTLNFTSSRGQGTISRLPRFPSDRPDRPRSYLEPVSETGAPIQQRPARPGSRLGHSAQSSVSAIPAPSTPTPSTPSRHGLRNTTSRPDMRYQPPTTTNSQLLRAKRSMPALNNLNSPTRSMFQRPPSRQDGSGSRLRTRSPERSESRLESDKKSMAPFLPAGASIAQSQHASIKTSGPRHKQPNYSDGSGESMSAAQRSLSRLAGIRPETPRKGGANLTPAELAAQAKKTMSKPLRKRNWGDGSELEIFDDLPTSATAEAKFTKQPIGRGAPRSMRSKLGQFGASNTSLVSAQSGADTSVPSTPLSPRHDIPVSSIMNSNVPRFARDTAASRNAREQRQISTAFQNVRGEPLQPISTNWKTSVPSRTPGSLRSKKKSVQQKPHLIKPMGGDMNRAKEEKGMHYDPINFRWEGNENALVPFDVPDFEPRTLSPVLKSRPGNVNSNGSPNGKPNFALITNLGAKTGVQLVNGMVFDPQQMKWLKVAEGERGESLRSGTGSVKIEEEEDVFAGLEDLKEEDDESAFGTHDRARSVSGQHHKNSLGGAAHTGREDIDKDDDNGLGGGGGGGGGSSGDEMAVPEEFDVGPAFVKKQRDEEERWRRKVEKWLRSEAEAAEDDREGPGGWRWAIRELVVSTESVGSGGGGATVF